MPCVDSVTATCYPGRPAMNVDDIISYHDVVNAEKAALQKGMNFEIGKTYSVFLMSMRRGAPYPPLSIISKLVFENNGRGSRKCL